MNLHTFDALIDADEGEPYPSSHRTMQRLCLGREQREVSHLRILPMIRTGSLDARQFPISVPDSYRSLASTLMTETMHSDYRDYLR